MKNPFKKALILEYLTLGWNVAGCIIIISAAITSSSISLFGFGIDSIIEIFASLVVIWQLKSVNKIREAMAMRLIGIAFLLLAVYLIVHSILGVTHRAQPHPSGMAIVWLIITAITMFLLAFGKSVAGIAINNAIVIKEAKVTAVDGLLALAVLIGLLFTKYFEWWWADIAVSVILAVYSILEAMLALR